MRYLDMGWMVRTAAFLCFCLITTVSWAQPSSVLPPNSDKTPAASERFVSIDFNDVDFMVFIKFISELTGKNFVVDQRIKGKVTIISPTRISVEEAYKVFESVLEVNGYATVPAGEVIKIVPSPDARAMNIETRLHQELTSPEDKVVTQLIPLKFADAEEIKKLMAPLISKNSVMLAYTPSNLLIITDVHSNIQRLMRILKTIDVEGIGLQLSIIPLKYADAVNFVNLLRSIFEDSKGGPRTKTNPEDTIRFEADERTNTLVILATEDKTLKIKDLIATLDKEIPRGSERIRVYYLENANAEDLAKVLQEIPSKQQESGEAGAKNMPVVSEKSRITADKATNSLIIMADKEDYQVFEDIIKKLDIPRAMVYIESLIMEVNVDKDFRLGTEWVVGDDTTFNDRDAIYGGGFSGGASGGDAGYQNLSTETVVGATTIKKGVPLPPGFSMGIFGEALSIGGISFPSIGAVVQAYKKDKDVHILSTPQVLTTDNQEATITVGKNVPFQTRTSTTDNDTYNSFEYKDVGKMLKITPQITKDRMVRLNISLEVTDLESSTDYRPTTLKRSVDTTVIVRDGNTVVIGGLIDDNITNTEYRVPCLGDVPLVGYLFKSMATGNSKTNLFVFLTPRVIESPAEAEAVYQDKKAHYDTVRENNIKLYLKPSAPENQSGVESIEEQR
ncbi:MAG: type II secretion system secretin GspD [Desulfobacterales bacterium]